MEVVKKLEARGLGNGERQGKPIFGTGSLDRDSKKARRLRFLEFGIWGPTAHFGNLFWRKRLAICNLGITGEAAIPPGSYASRAFMSGGVAALDHRLMAGNPPGSEGNSLNVFI